jgi:hypothetical protein
MRSEDDKWYVGSDLEDDPDMFQGTIQEFNGKTEENHEKNFRTTAKAAHIRKVYLQLPMHQITHVCQCEHSLTH